MYKKVSVRSDSANAAVDKTMLILSAYKWQFNSKKVFQTPFYTTINKLFGNHFTKKKRFSNDHKQRVGRKNFTMCVYQYVNCSVYTTEQLSGQRNSYSTLLHVVCYWIHMLTVYQYSNHVQCSTHSHSLWRPLYDTRSHEINSLIRETQTTTVSSVSCSLSQLPSREVCQLSNWTRPLLCPRDVLRHPNLYNGSMHIGGGRIARSQCFGPVGHFFRYYQCMGSTENTWGRPKLSQTLWKVLMWPSPICIEPFYKYRYWRTSHKH